MPGNRVGPDGGEAVPATNHSRPAVVTVPRYLAAVRTMHALGVRDLARALHVTPSVVRRWLGAASEHSRNAWTRDRVAQQLSRRNAHDARAR